MKSIYSVCQLVQKREAFALVVVVAIVVVAVVVTGICFPFAVS